jgi:peptide/nickel transport system substrate-binding protein
VEKIALILGRLSMLKRGLMLVCISVGLAFLVSSCRNETSKPAEESVIIIGTTDNITVLDPVYAIDIHTTEVLRNTLEALLKYRPGTSELVPALAEELPIASPDGKEWTLKLRRGLKFSNGTPFNAEVVKYSIDRAIEIKAQGSWLVSDFVESIEIVDDYTVKFILKDSYAFFPSLLASMPYYPVNPNMYEKDKAMGDDTNKLASIGPYKIERVIRDQELVLTRNPTYYGEPAKTDKIVIKYYKDPTTMRLAIEKGEIDIAWRSLNPLDLTNLKSKGNLNIIESKSTYIGYISFTCNRPPFNEKKLRQAIAYAVNRAPIIDKIFIGLADPLYSMVPAGMWSHKDLFKDTPDLAKSRALVESLGYSSEKPFSFELWYTLTRFGGTEGDMALLIKQQLEDTGVIKVDLKSVEFGTALDNLGRGNMDAFFWGWFPDYVDPDDYTAAFALTQAGGTIGIHYSNPKMDELLKKGRTTNDENEREKIYEEIQDYWAEEVPTVPLVQTRLFLVTRSNIRGVVVSPTLAFYYDSIYKE